MQRKLDFKNNLMANKPSLPRPNGVNKGKGKTNAITNGHRSSPSEAEEEEEEESLAVLDGGEDYTVEDEAEEPDETPEEPVAELHSSPPSAKKPKGRPKKTPVVGPEEEPIVASIEEDAEPADEPVQAGKKRGRPAKSKSLANEEPVPKKAKKVPHAVEEEEEGESSEQPPAKKGRGRTKAPVTADAAPKPAIPKQKRSGKQRASPAVGDTSVVEVPRGPPLPKSRGLVITRRETPGASATFTTRSGRTSFQPLKFWRNERAELEDDAPLEDGKQKIMLPKIKEIVRYEDPEPDVKAAGRRKGKASGKKASRRRAFGEEEDEDLEEWEQDGDIITGEVVVWQPEHEFNPPGPDEQIEVAADQEIAISANAVQTREIRNATFKFAKVLSTPFFGAGVVDLPPHSEKKPKNARKMQMAFFVFAGRVQVTVADTAFTIGRGGMWFVPRGESTILRTFNQARFGELTFFFLKGNYYSIENLTTKPARIFFAQGCELSSQASGDISQLA